MLTVLLTRGSILVNYVFVVIAVVSKKGGDFIEY